VAELLPGQAKKDITALQAKALLASVRPRDIAGKTRRRLAAEELSGLCACSRRRPDQTATVIAALSQGTRPTAASSKPQREAT
jgi:hypothetical protein